ncbi:MAG: hypothetical protein AAGN46_09780 [Acidobacteriota bacterium]
MFSLRTNGGAFRDIPVTLITNSEPLSAAQKGFLENHFSPIDFRTGPRLGAIRHTSKLNVFYSIDPSSYDVLLYMDCDTVVRRPLDRMVDRIRSGEAHFVCRRGGRTDRNRFPDFDALVRRFCGPGPKKKVLHGASEEWPMFNSGVFLGTAEAIRTIRKDAIEFTYRLFNEWQRIDVIEKLPPELKAVIEAEYPSKVRTQQDVLDDWPIEQGALALACIKAGINVRYLEEAFNSWGGDEDFHVLHCFKSLYKFRRGAMFSADAEPWIAEYLESDIPGKRFLGGIVRKYRHTFSGDRSRESREPQSILS